MGITLLVSETPFTEIKRDPIINNAAHVTLHWALEPIAILQKGYLSISEVLNDLG